jgi:hypothetical protein
MEPGQLTEDAKTYKGANIVTHENSTRMAERSPDTGHHVVPSARL